MLQMHQQQMQQQYQQQQVPQSYRQSPAVPRHLELYDVDGLQDGPHGLQGGGRDMLPQELLQQVPHGLARDAQHEMRGEMLRHQRDVQRDQELEFGTPHPQSMQGMPSGLVTATQSGRPPSLQQQKVGEAIRDAEVTLRLLERAVNRAAPTAPTSRQSISRPASASSLHRGGSHARRPASANASMPGQRLAAARAYATGGDDRTRMATMHAPTPNPPQNPNPPTQNPNPHPNPNSNPNLHSYPTPNQARAAHA